MKLLGTLLIITSVAYLLMGLFHTELLLWSPLFSVFEFTNMAFTMRCVASAGMTGALVLLLTTKECSIQK